jgi:hypothetical protein
MGTPARDEGLDQLEAFIALMDRTRDRLEEGAERLGALATALGEGAAELQAEENRLQQMLAEHLGQAGGDDGEAEDAAGAVAKGGQGAMALALVMATAIAELSAEAGAGGQATSGVAARLEETATALVTLVEASLEALVAEAADTLAGNYEEHVVLLAELLRQLQELQVAASEELSARAQQKGEDVRVWLEESNAAGAALATTMIAISVLLVVIAVIAAVLSLGSATGVSVALIVAAVAVIVAATGALAATVAMNIVPLAQGLAVILKYMGFSQLSEDLDAFLDNDMVKTATLAAMVAITIATVITSLGSAVGLAVVLIALAMPLAIALRVVENVARLLSALNPFD